MIVAILRHDPVELEMSGSLSASYFENLMAAYDAAPLRQNPDLSVALPSLADYDLILISPLRRTRETMERCPPGSNIPEIRVLHDLREVTLIAHPWLARFRQSFPVSLWFIADRFSWMTGIPAHPDNRLACYRRAMRVLQVLHKLKKQGKKRVLLVSHGWFISCIKAMAGPVTASVRPADHRELFIIEI